MTAAIRYRVSVADAHAHLFGIELEIDGAASGLRLSLPVWIPGSYLVREFAQHLQGLQASRGARTVPLRQLNKNTWQVGDWPPGRGPLRLRYQVYAFDSSVRTAWLEAARGFFNGTSLCLRVHGREDEAHQIELLEGEATRGWQVATALQPLAVRRNGFGRYAAASYDELVDAPVEMGPFWSGRFVVRGVPHRFVVSGAPPGFDGQRLLRDAKAICAEHIAFWHGPREQPAFDRYVFLLHATTEGYGGLEHRHSTALICQRSDLPLLEREAAGGDGPGAAANMATSPTTKPTKPSEGYTTLLGLISHEYFHTWNVKRLRPREFARYDYERENHTELLWFFEGYTSYYDDLMLRRAGLIDRAAYLKLLAKTINQVLQTPGRQVQSVAQASFDAWTKYYRVNENTPNATVSYYTKGSLVALCLDLTLRQEGRSTLDAVMRALYARCQGGPMREADLLAVLRELGGRAFDREIADWVHGTGDLPLQPLLKAMGLHWIAEPAPLAQRLGLRVQDGGGSVLVKGVLRGSAAEAAGMAAGDEWLGLQPLDGSEPPGNGQAGWRLKKLDDAALAIGRARQAQALVARDGRLLSLRLQWPAPAHKVALALPQQRALPAVADAWLGP